MLCNMLVIYGLDNKYFAPLWQTKHTEKGNAKSKVHLNYIPRGAIYHNY